MEIISPINQQIITNRTNNSSNTSIQTNTNNTSADEFVKENKSKKTKKIIGASIALVALGVSAFMFRKNISSVFSKFKSSISFKGTNKSKAKLLDLTKTEKIQLPTGSYDLTKEAKSIGVDTHTPALGFANMGTTIGKKIENLKNSTPKNHTNVGITDNGKAFVSAGYRAFGLEDCWQDFNKPLDNANKRGFCGITLYSDDSNFTPAQKNLIAIMHQKLTDSENSMVYGKNRLIFDFKEGEKLENKITLEELFEKLAAWSKDIDTENEETQKILAGLGSIKKGQGFFIPKEITEEGIKLFNA